MTAGSTDSIGTGGGFADRIHYPTAEQQRELRHAVMGSPASFSVDGLTADQRAAALRWPDWLMLDLDERAP